MIYRLKKLPPSEGRASNQLTQAIEHHLYVKHPVAHAYYKTTDIHSATHILREIATTETITTCAIKACGVYYRAGA